MLRLRVASISETTPLQIHAPRESKAYSIEEKVEEIVSPSSYSPAIAAKTTTTITSPNPAKNTNDGITTKITAGSQDKAARESSSLWGFSFPSTEGTGNPSPVKTAPTEQSSVVPLNPDSKEDTSTEKKKWAFLRSLCF